MISQFLQNIQLFQRLQAWNLDFTKFLSPFKVPFRLAYSVIVLRIKCQTWELMFLRSFFQMIKNFKVRLFLKAFSHSLFHFTTIQKIYLTNLFAIPLLSTFIEPNSSLWLNKVLDCITNRDSFQTSSNQNLNDLLLAKLL